MNFDDPNYTLGQDFQPLAIYEQVAEQIKSCIASGEFALESRLPSERDLASRYSVSRPAVREAIGALQNQGLVFTKRGSGTYVTENAILIIRNKTTQSSSGTHADDSPLSILEARLLLEPTIAMLAARMKQRDPQAEFYLQQMQSVNDISIPSQQLIWSESDRLFHRQLSMMTCNKLIIRISNEIAKSMEQPLWQRLRDDGIYDPDRINLYISEHRLIYEAIITGNEDAAGFYVRQHLLRVMDDIKNASPSNS